MCNCELQCCQLWSAKGFVHSVDACFLHVYTRGLKQQPCQTVWTVFVSSLSLFSILSLLPSVSEAEADETGHFSPYCPACQAPLFENLTAVNSDCYRTAGSTPAEPPNTNDLPPPAVTECVSAKLQSDMQHECVWVCVCVCARVSVRAFYFIYDWAGFLSSVTGWICPLTPAEQLCSSAPPHLHDLRPFMCLLGLLNVEGCELHKI